MSFQAYLDNIKAQTGKGPEDFIALAAERGLSKAKAREIYTWLNEEFGLGRGHAMAIFSVIQADGAPRATAEERLEKLFTGGRAKWRPAFEDLLARTDAFGPVVVDPTDTYAGLTKAGKKFAIFQPGAGHVDVGIKRKGVEPTDRFAAAGAWNSMVTHRTRATDAAQLDAELLEWLKAAYDAA